MLVLGRFYLSFSHIKNTHFGKKEQCISFNEFDLFYASCLQKLSVDKDRQFNQYRQPLTNLPCDLIMHCTLCFMAVQFHGPMLQFLFNYVTFTFYKN